MRHLCQPALLFFVQGFFLVDHLHAENNPVAIPVAAIKAPQKAVADKPKTSRLERIRAELANAATGKVLVVAHRACWKKAPENSLPAIRDAIALGSDIVEIDLQRTKDGVFVIMHDGTVDRTTNGKGKVSDFTLEELKKLRLKGLDGKLTEEPVPTLAEALEQGKDLVLFNLDKSDRYLNELLPWLRKSGTTRQVLVKGTLDLQKLRQQLAEDRDLLYMPIFRKYSPKKTAEAAAPVQPLTMDTLYPMDGEVRAIELSFGTLDQPELAPEIFKQFKQRNIRVWTNTLAVSHPADFTDKSALKNPDQIWGKLIERGFSIIQTDEHQALLEYLRKKGLHD